MIHRPAWAVCTTMPTATARINNQKQKKYSEYETI